MLYLLALLPLLSLASAKAAWKTTLNANSGAGEFWSCDSAVTTGYVYDFTPLGLGDYSAFYDAMCGYPPCVGAMMLCCEELVDGDKSIMEKIYSVAADSCSQYSSYHYDASYYKEQHENATANYRPNSEITNLTLPVYFPTLPNMTTAETKNSGYKAYYKNLDSGTWYSIGCIVYFAVLALVAMVINFLKRTGAVKSVCHPLVNKFRSYCTIPALLPNGSYADEAGWKFISSLLPNRVEGLVSIGLSIIQIVFYCISYRQVQGADLFMTSTDALKRFVGDRSGVMAFGKVPLLVLFAGRNNILIWLTGVKYSSYIQYHKVVSRWMFIDALIHSVAYTVYVGGIGSDTYSSDMEELYWVCGVVATIVCSIMVLFSLDTFRRYTYELFLYFHLISALAFLILCWYHCRTLGWCEWLIASYALWVFDRVLRIVRCVMFGSKKAQIELISEDSYKVTISRPKMFNPLPGQYGFIYFRDALLWFQNHPFTLVNTGDNIEVYITAKKGITNRILKQLKKNGGRMQKSVTIEGPYGEHSPVEKYDHALFIGGGAGIPGIADNANKLSQLNTKETVKLIYIERTLNEAHVYLKDLVSELKGSKAQVELYLTRENEGAADNYLLSSTDSNNATEKGSNSEKDTDSSNVDCSHTDTPSMTSIDFINVHYGRPDVKQLVADECSEANGSLAIVTCGPGKMVDQVRAATASAVACSKNRIDLYDELQKW